MGRTHRGGARSEASDHRGGAGRTRTGDLLGAIQANPTDIRAGRRCGDDRVSGFEGRGDHLIDVVPDGDRTILTTTPTTLAA